MKPPPAFLRDTAGFLAFVVGRWREDRCPQVAGSLTFTTLLALVPLFTVVVAVLSALPFFDGVMVQIKIFLLLNLVPEIAGKIITVYMEQFAQSAGHLTAVSLAALFAMAIAMLFTVDHSLNVIWRVDRRRPVWLSVAGYTALIALGPALMGLSLWATSWLVAASLDRVAMPSQVEALALRVVPISMSALAFFLVYRIIPNRHVPALHAAAGGILAAVAFEAMKSLFATYIREVPTYKLVYGAFAAIPIFLLWLYLAWLVVLFGAVFTASLSDWRRKTPPGTAPPEKDLRGAFEIARALFAAQGEAVTSESLRESVGMPEEEFYDLLRDLAAAGVIRRSGRGWTLAAPSKGMSS